MDPRDSQIRLAVQDLISQVLAKPGPEQPSVFAHLGELLALHQLLIEQKLEAQIHQQVCYDLILLTACKIVREYKRTDWVIEYLLILSDSFTESMTPLLQKLHPFRRGLVLYRYMNYSALFELGDLAAKRLGEIFTTVPPMTLGRRFKISLGNLFAGVTNMSVLAEIYPSLIQWMIPLGQFKYELNAFINVLLTQLLTLPKMNGEISSLDWRIDSDQIIDQRFDFSQIMNLFLFLSDKRLETSMGEDEECPWVCLVRAATKMLADFHGILVNSDPNFVQTALRNKPMLRENLNQLFTPLQGLVPIYTMGSVLDEALRELVLELQSFSQCLVKIMKNPEQQYYIDKQPWDLMGDWSNLQLSFYSMTKSFERMVTSSMPKIFLLIHRTISDPKAPDLGEKITPDLNKMRDQALSLSKCFDALGVYHPLTQTVITSFRDKMKNVKLESIQRLISCYYHQLEPVLQNMSLQSSVDQWWTGLSADEKWIIKMNLAFMLHHVNDLMGSLAPIFEVKNFAALRNQLDNHKDLAENFDALILTMKSLVQILHDPKEGLPQIKTALDHLFNSAGESVSLGSAAQAIPVVGSVIAGAAHLSRSHRMDLSFVPSEKMAGLPLGWKGLSMKQIYKHELNLIFRYLEALTPEAFDNIYVHRLKFPTASLRGTQ